MRMELPVGKEHYLAQWYYDTLCSVRPQIERLHLPIESLGSLDTLVHRLQAEVAESKTFACWFASVGAWCRKAYPNEMFAVRCKMFDLAKTSGCCLSI